MPVYMMFVRDNPVHDQEAMAEYQRLNRKGPNNVPVKPLVAYGATEAIEGEAPDGVVLLEFPTAEDAKAWYNSPAYQAAIPHRQKAADYRAFIVEGLPQG